MISYPYSFPVNPVKILFYIKSGKAYSIEENPR